MKEAMVKCSGLLSEGKFETDYLYVTSPTPRTVSVWLHSKKLDGLTTEERSMYSAVLNRAREAYREKNTWEWEHGRNVDSRSPEWRTYINALRKRYPLGIGVFWLPLTRDEMRMLLKLHED